MKAIEWRTSVASSFFAKYTDVRKPNLLSLGLVTLDGQEHYLEIDVSTKIGWLIQEARALGGRRPLDLIEEPNGIEQLEQMLRQIEAGVYL